MGPLRTIARVFGWLLTPFVAWAASFLGASILAGAAAAIPSPRAGFLLTAAGAFASAIVALWYWLRLLRRSPELRETLQVTEEGSPVAAEGTLAATLGEEEDSPMRREFLLVGILVACGGEPPREPAPPPPEAEAAGPDSLVLRLAGGAEVWFTGSREARDSAGVPCIERVLEIRRDTVRRAVPLLYTREAPVPVDDTLFRATLSRDCAPAGTYLVSATDGQPHRETP